MPAALYSIPPNSEIAVHLNKIEGGQKKPLI